MAAQKPLLGCLALQAPAGARIAPEELAASEREAELQVRTFPQATPHCGLVTRRYLLYVPRATAPARAAVILLHGLGASAESFRGFQTHAAFEALAHRHGFLVVYANAAPSSASDVRIPNSGGWRAHADASTEIDDVGYLDTVVAELQSQRLLAEGAKVFLAGQSNGGGMVLEAARRRPGFYAAIAAFMPFAGWEPTPPAGSETLPPLLLAYSDADPGLPAHYAERLRRFVDGWASAMRAAPDVLASSARPLPDPVEEGAGYDGNLPVPLRTRASKGLLEEAWREGPQAQRILAVRVLHFDRAGHFWPHPQQDTAPWALNRWGFRNQDLDGAAACWDFFATVTRQEPALR